MQASSQRFAFHRESLAADLANSLEGKGLIDSTSGLFLAAPRRTGKSTFLREYLLPEANRRGWTTIYVDLWSDHSRNPMILIADAIKSEITAQGGLIARLVKSTGLDKLSLMGSLTFDLSKMGQSGSLTLADALSRLAEQTQKPILLIVDEAQHALSSEEGIRAMFALKAARDQLNQGTVSHRMYMVFTGSHRDKLAHLVLNKDQPFFGSQVTSFPLLMKDFTDAYTDWVNARLSNNNQFDREAMYKAFRLLGHRPEWLKSMVADIALSLGEAPNLDSLLEQKANEIRNQHWNSYNNELIGLTDLQRAVLLVIAEKGKGFSAFTEESMLAYRSKLTTDAVIPAHAVQTAIEGLRERNLIWRSARGTYALEDESMAEWLGVVSQSLTLKNG